MLYDDQLCTVYAVENGFVVECREPKKEGEKSSKKDPCCPEPTQTKTYTASTPAAVLKIVKARLAGSRDEYEDGFEEATNEK